MTKLSDISATLSLLAQQFASLQLEGMARSPRPNGAGIPLEADKRKEIKDLLRHNASATHPIPMATIAKIHGVSRPTLYAIKKELEREKDPQARKQ
jgi:DNA invertase Pin-like site-specific DNA recombinase